MPSHLLRWFGPEGTKTSCGLPFSLVSDDSCHNWYKMAFFFEELNRCAVCELAAIAASLENDA